MITDDIRSFEFRDFFEHCCVIGNGVLRLVATAPSVTDECEGKEIFLFKKV